MDNNKDVTAPNERVEDKVRIALEEGVASHKSGVIRISEPLVDQDTAPNTVHELYNKDLGGLLGRDALYHAAGVDLKRGQTYTDFIKGGGIAPRGYHIEHQLQLRSETRRHEYERVLTGDMGLETFLFENYGREHLKEKGIDPTNPLYWYDRLKKGQPANLGFSELQLQEGLSTAYELFQAEEWFGYMNSSAEHSLLVELVGREITGEHLSQLFPHYEEMSEALGSWEDFLIAHRAGMAPGFRPVIQADPEDENSEITHYLHTDGVLYEVADSNDPRADDSNVARAYYNDDGSLRYLYLGESEIRLVQAGRQMLTGFMRGLTSVFDLVGGAGSIVSGLLDDDKTIGEYYRDFQKERTSWFSSLSDDQMYSEASGWDTDNIVFGAASAIGTTAGFIASMKLTAGLSAKGAAIKVGAKKKMVAHTTRALGDKALAAAPKTAATGKALTLGARNVSQRAMGQAAARTGAKKGSMRAYQGAVNSLTKFKTGAMPRAEASGKVTSFLTKSMGMSKAAAGKEATKLLNEVGQSSIQVANVASTGTQVLMAGPTREILKQGAVSVPLRLNMAKWGGNSMSFLFAVPNKMVSWNAGAPMSAKAAVNPWWNVTEKVMVDAVANSIIVGSELAARQELLELTSGEIAGKTMANAAFNAALTMAFTGGTDDVGALNRWAGGWGMKKWPDIVNEYQRIGAAAGKYKFGRFLLHHPAFARWGSLTLDVTENALSMGVRMNLMQTGTLPGVDEEGFANLGQAMWNPQFIVMQGLMARRAWAGRILASKGTTEGLRSFQAFRGIGEVENVYRSTISTLETRATNLQSEGKMDQAAKLVKVRDQLVHSVKTDTVNNKDMTIMEAQLKALDNFNTAISNELGESTITTIASRELKGSRMKEFVAKQKMVEAYMAEKLNTKKTVIHDILKHNPQGWWENTKNSLANKYDSTNRFFGRISEALDQSKDRVVTNVNKSFRDNMASIYSNIAESNAGVRTLEDLHRIIFPELDNITDYIRVMDFSTIDAMKGKGVTEEEISQLTRVLTEQYDTDAVNKVFEEGVVIEVAPTKTSGDNDGEGQVQKIISALNFLTGFSEGKNPLITKVGDNKYFLAINLGVSGREGVAGVSKVASFVRAYQVLVHTDAKLENSITALKSIFTVVTGRDISEITSREGISTDEELLGEILYELSTGDRKEGADSVKFEYNLPKDTVIKLLLKSGSSGESVQRKNLRTGFLKAVKRNNDNNNSIKRMIEVIDSHDKLVETILSIKADSEQGIDVKGFQFRRLDKYIKEYNDSSEQVRKDLERLKLINSKALKEWISAVEETKKSNPQNPQEALEKWLEKNSSTLLKGKATKEAKQKVIEMLLGDNVKDVKLIKSIEARVNGLANKKFLDSLIKNNSAKGLGEAVNSARKILLKDILDDISSSEYIKNFFGGRLNKREVNIISKAIKIDELINNIVSDDGNYITINKNHLRNLNVQIQEGFKDIIMSRYDKMVSEYDAIFNEFSKGFEKIVLDGVEEVRINTAEFMPKEVKRVLSEIDKRKSGTDPRGKEVSVKEILKQSDALTHRQILMYKQFINKFKLEGTGRITELKFDMTDMNDRRSLAELLFNFGYSEKPAELVEYHNNHRSNIPGMYFRKSAESGVAFKVKHKFGQARRNAKVKLGKSQAREDLTLKKLKHYINAEHIESVYLTGDTRISIDEDSLTAEPYGNFIGFSTGRALLEDVVTAKLKRAGSDSLKKGLSDSYVSKVRGIEYTTDSDLSIIDLVLDRLEIINDRLKQGRLGITISDRHNLTKQDTVKLEKLGWKFNHSNNTIIGVDIDKFTQAFPKIIGSKEFSIQDIFPIRYDPSTILKDVDNANPLYPGAYRGKDLRVIDDGGANNTFAQGMLQFLIGDSSEANILLQRISNHDASSDPFVFKLSTVYDINKPSDQILKELSKGMTVNQIIKKFRGSNNVYLKSLAKRLNLSLRMKAVVEEKYNDIDENLRDKIRIVYSNPDALEEIQRSITTKGTNQFEGLGETITKILNNSNEVTYDPIRYNPDKGARKPNTKFFSGVNVTEGLRILPSKLPAGFRLTDEDVQEIVSIASKDLRSTQQRGVLLDTDIFNVQPTTFNKLTSLIEIHHPSLGRDEGFLPYSSIQRFSAQELQELRSFVASAENKQEVLDYFDSVEDANKLIDNINTSTNRSQSSLFNNRSFGEDFLPFKAVAPLDSATAPSRRFPNEGEANAQANRLARQGNKTALENAANDRVKASDRFTDAAEHPFHKSLSDMANEELMHMSHKGSLLLPNLRNPKAVINMVQEVSTLADAFINDSLGFKFSMNSEDAYRTAFQMYLSAQGSKFQSEYTKYWLFKPVQKQGEEPVMKAERFSGGSRSEGVELIRNLENLKNSLGEDYKDAKIGVIEKDQFFFNKDKSTTSIKDRSANLKFLDLGDAEEEINMLKKGIVADITRGMGEEDILSLSRDSGRLRKEIENYFISSIPARTLINSIIKDINADPEVKRALYETINDVVSKAPTNSKAEELLEVSLTDKGFGSLNPSKNRYLSKVYNALTRGTEFDSDKLSEGFRIVFNNIKKEYGDKGNLAFNDNLRKGVTHDKQVAFTASDEYEESVAISFLSHLISTKDPHMITLLNELISGRLDGSISKPIKDAFSTIYNRPSKSYAIRYGELKRKITQEKLDNTTKVFIDTEWMPIGTKVDTNNEKMIYQMSVRTIDGATKKLKENKTFWLGEFTQDQYKKDGRFLASREFFRNPKNEDYRIAINRRISANKNDLTSNSQMKNYMENLISENKNNIVFVGHNIRGDDSDIANLKSILGENNTAFMRKNSIDTLLDLIEDPTNLHDLYASDFSTGRKTLGDVAKILAMSGETPEKKALLDMLEKSELHDAEFDVMLTEKVFDILRNPSKLSENFLNPLKSKYLVYQETARKTSAWEPDNKKLLKGIDNHIKEIVDTEIKRIEDNKSYYSNIKQDILESGKHERLYNTRGQSFHNTEVPKILNALQMQIDISENQFKNSVIYKDVVNRFTGKDGKFIDAITSRKGKSNFNFIIGFLMSRLDPSNKNPAQTISKMLEAMYGELRRDPLTNETIGGKTFTRQNLKDAVVELSSRPTKEIFETIKKVDASIYPDFKGLQIPENIDKFISDNRGGFEQLIREHISDSDTLYRAQASERNEMTSTLTRKLGEGILKNTSTMFKNKDITNNDSLMTDIFNRLLTPTSTSSETAEYNKLINDLFSHSIKGSVEQGIQELIYKEGNPYTNKTVMGYANLIPSYRKLGFKATPGSKKRSYTQDPGKLTINPYTAKSLFFDNTRLTDSQLLDQLEIMGVKYNDGGIYTGVLRYPSDKIYTIHGYKIIIDFADTSKANYIGMHPLDAINHGGDFDSDKAMIMRPNAAINEFYSREHTIGNKNNTIRGWVDNVKNIYSDMLLTRDLDADYQGQELLRMNLGSNLFKIPEIYNTALSLAQRLTDPADNLTYDSSVETIKELLVNRLDSTLPSNKNREFKKATLDFRKLSQEDKDDSIDYIIRNNFVYNKRTGNRDNLFFPTFSHKDIGKSVQEIIEVSKISEIDLTLKDSDTGFTTKDSGKFPGTPITKKVDGKDFQFRTTQLEDSVIERLQAVMFETEDGPIRQDSYNKLKDITLKRLGKIEGDKVIKTLGNREDLTIDKFLSTMVNYERSFLQSDNFLKMFSKSLGDINPELSDFSMMQRMERISAIAMSPGFKNTYMTLGTGRFSNEEMDQLIQMGEFHSEGKYDSNEVAKFTIDRARKNGLTLPGKLLVLDSKHLKFIGADDAVYQTEKSRANTLITRFIEVKTHSDLKALKNKFSNKIVREVPLKGEEGYIVEIRDVELGANTKIGLAEGSSLVKAPVHPNVLQTKDLLESLRASGNTSIQKEDLDEITFIISSSMLNKLDVEKTLTSAKKPSINFRKKIIDDLEFVLLEDTKEFTFLENRDIDLMSGFQNENNWQNGAFFKGLKFKLNGGGDAEIDDTALVNYKTALSTRDTPSLTQSNQASTTRLLRLLTVLDLVSDDIKQTRVYKNIRDEITQSAKNFGYDKETYYGPETEDVMMSSIHKLYGGVEQGVDKFFAILEQEGTNAQKALFTKEINQDLKGALTLRAEGVPADDTYTKGLGIVTDPEKKKTSIDGFARTETIEKESGRNRVKDLGFVGGVKLLNMLSADANKALTHDDIKRGLRAGIFSTKKVDDASFSSYFKNTTQAMREDNEKFNLADLALDSKTGVEASKVDLDVGRTTAINKSLLEVIDEDVPRHSFEYSHYKDTGIDFLRNMYHIKGGSDPEFNTRSPYVFTGNRLDKLMVDVNTTDNKPQFIQKHYEGMPKRWSVSKGKTRMGISPKGDLEMKTDPFGGIRQTFDSYEDVGKAFAEQLSNKELMSKKIDMVNNKHVEVIRAAIDLEVQAKQEYFSIKELALPENSYRLMDLYMTELKKNLEQDGYDIKYLDVIETKSRELIDEPEKEYRLMRRNFLNKLGINPTRPEDAALSQAVEGFTRIPRALEAEYKIKLAAFLKSIDTPEYLNVFNKYVSIRSLVEAEDSPEIKEFIKKGGTKATQVKQDIESELREVYNLSIEDAKKYLIDFESLNRDRVEAFNGVVKDIFDAASTIAEARGIMSPNLFSVMRSYSIQPTKSNYKKRKALFVNTLDTLLNYDHLKKGDTIKGALSSLDSNFIVGLDNIVRNISKVQGSLIMSRRMLDAGIIHNKKIITRAEELFNSRVKNFNLADKEEAVMTSEFKFIIDSMSRLNDPSLNMETISARQGENIIIKTLDALQEAKMRIIEENPKAKYNFKEELSSSKFTAADEEFTDILKTIEDASDAIRYRALNKSKELSMEVGNLILNARNIEGTLVNEFGQKIDPIIDDWSLGYRPLAEMDLGYINDVAKFSMSSDDKHIRFALAALGGKIFTMDTKLANHINKHFFTSKIPGPTTKVLLDIRNNASKLIMSSLPKILSRFSIFTGYDISRAISINPRSLLTLAQSRKDLTALYKSKGQFLFTEKGKELLTYIRKTGLNPITGKNLNVDTFNSTTMSPEILKPYFDISDKAFSFQTQFGRYAMYLSVKNSFEKHGTSGATYGPTLHRKAMIDALDSPEAKAIEVMDASLGSPGGFPMASKYVTNWFMFTTFPLALVNYGVETARSANVALKNIISGEDTTSSAKTLMTVGGELVVSSLILSLMVQAIGNMYNMDEDTIEQWSSDLATIDPIMTLLHGRPVRSYNNSFSAYQNIKENYFNPLKENGIEGLFVRNIAGPINPLIKTPLEIITNKDFFGHEARETDYKWQENLFRKLVGYAAGIAGSTAMVEEWRFSKLNMENPSLVERVYGSMTKGLMAEMGNNRGYRLEQRNYFQAMSIINAQIAIEREQYRAESSASTPGASFSTFDPENVGFSNFDSDTSFQLQRSIKSAMDRGQPPSVIYGILDEAIRNGIGESEFTSALKRNSIQARLGTIRDKKSFMSMLSESDASIIEKAFLYERKNYSIIGDLINEQETEGRYPSSSYRRSLIPNRFLNPPRPTYSPYRQNAELDLYEPRKEWSPDEWEPEPRRSRPFVPSFTKYTGRRARVPQTLRIVDRNRNFTFIPTSRIQKPARDRSDFIDRSNWRKE